MGAAYCAGWCLLNFGLAIEVWLEQGGRDGGNASAGGADFSSTPQQ